MSSHRSGYSLTVGRSRKEDDFNVEQSVFNNLPDSSNPKFLELSPRKRLKPPKIPSPAKSRHSTLLPETPRKSEDLNHDKRQRRSLPSDQGRTNRKSAVSLEDDRSDYQHGENSLSTTLSLTPQSTPRDTSRRFSDNPNINVSRSEYSSHLSDSSRRIDYALVLLREAIVDNRPEKAKLAKYHISQFSNDLAEHRMKRKSKTPSKPKLQDNEFGEITKLVAMAISARKVCERSTNNSTSTETLRVLKDVGALTILAQGLAEGVIQPETSGGRAILSVLSEASAVPETQVAVTDAFKTDPPRLARVCHGIMKNKHHPVAARNQTARIVKNSSVDPDVKRRMLSESPKMLTLADATLKETTPLLVRAGFVQQRGRKSVTAIEEVIVDLAGDSSNLEYSMVANYDEEVESPTNISFREEVDEKALKQFYADIDKIKNEESYLDQNKADTGKAALEVADILLRSAKICKTQDFTDANGHELLLKLAKQNEHNKNVIGPCLNAFARASDIDPIVREFCVERVELEIDPKAAAQDRVAAEAQLALITDAVFRRRKKNGGIRDELTQTMKAKNFQIFIQTFEETEYEDSMALKENIEWLKEIPSVDKPGLTLKEAHQQLIRRQSNQESMQLDEDRALRRLFEFIYETLEIYLRNPIHDVVSFLGQEVMYGCLAFQLFLDEGSNEHYLIYQSVPNLLIDGMKKQGNAQVAQHMVLSACELCARSPAICIAFAKVPNGAAIATELVQRGLVEVSTWDPFQVENLMKPRLELIQYMAYNRQIFAKTSIMDNLISQWNSTDLYYFNEIQNTTLKELKRLYKRENVDATKEMIETAVRKGLGGKEVSSFPENLSPPQSPVGNRRRCVSSSNPLQHRRSSQFGSGSPLPKKGLSSLFGKKEEVPPASSSVTGSQQVTASSMQRRVSLTPEPGGKILPLSISSVSSDSSSSQDTVFDVWLYREDPGPIMLPHILRTMRKTVCGQFLKSIEENQIPMRLAGLVLDNKTNPAVLPDVLFLIGALAVVPDIRDHFGQIMTVEGILGLIRRAYTHDGLYVVEIVANSCLALANLCMVHVDNTSRFNKYKGAKLIVRVLRKRGQINDAKSVNGASALMCNLCFKNLKMKEKLGDEGACEALVAAIRAYRGSGGDENSRCVCSTFKAIGNLSLNEHNMNYFMEADIPSAYANFLEEAEDELDAITLEACFRTLANLVIERDNVEKFESSVSPILSFIRRTRKDAPEMYRWALEAIGNLCRWPGSADAFTTNEGIQTILSLPFLPKAESCHSSAIFVLGIQTSNKENIPILIEAGILDFIKNLLDRYVIYSKGLEGVGDLHSVKHTKENLSPIVPIATVRCLRRLITTRDNANKCLSSGCVGSMLEAIKFSWKMSMFVYEAFRVIFAILSVNNGSEGPLGPSLQQPQSPRKLMSGSSLVRKLQSKESRLIKAALSIRQFSMGLQTRDAYDFTPYSTYSHYYGNQDRPRDRVPLGRRAYEILELRDEDIEDLIEVTRRALAEGTLNLKLYRLGLGCLTYFACEKKGLDALYRRIQFDDDVEQVPTEAWNKWTRHDLQMAALASPRNVKKPGVISRLFRKTNNQNEELEKAQFGTQRPKDKTSIIDLIFNALNAFMMDPLIVEEAIMLLYHVVLCVTNERELESIADKTFYEEFKNLTHKNDFLLGRAKSAVTLYKFMLDKGYDATFEDMQQYYYLVDFEYPLELSGWNDEAYPDGVQSLPNEIKNFLRQGGKLDVYTIVTTSDGQRKPEQQKFLWKSSHDLIELRWEIRDVKEKNALDPLYSNGIPISSVSGVHAGITNATFAEIAKMLSLSESVCIGIIGPTTPEFPNGLVLNLRAKGSKERDSFIQVLYVWREAAAYAFH